MKNFLIFFIFLSFLNSIANGKNDNNNSNIKTHTIIIIISCIIGVIIIGLISWLIYHKISKKNSENYTKANVTDDDLSKSISQYDLEQMQLTNNNDIDDDFDDSDVLITPSPFNLNKIKNIIIARFNEKTEFKLKTDKYKNTKVVYNKGEGLKFQILSNVFLHSINKKNLSNKKLLNKQESIIKSFYQRCKFKDNKIKKISDINNIILLTMQLSIRILNLKNKCTIIDDNIDDISKISQWIVYDKDFDNENNNDIKNVFEYDSKSFTLLYFKKLQQL